MKKYNKVTSIMFWLLLFAVITSIASLTAVKEINILSLLTDSKNQEKEVIVQKEPVIVRKVEVETVEWFYFVATGYSANDPSQGTTNVTATGKQVHEGVIAVDPDIIPLGSEVEIKGIGLFVAEDVGGKIKNNRVDIYFNSKEKALEFGKKGIWLRMVDESKNIQLAELIKH